MNSDFFCVNKECEFYLKPCPIDWDEDDEGYKLEFCKACGAPCRTYGEGVWEG